MSSNTNNRENEIVEDVPQYRSVMMAGPLSAPPMPRSFAAMRPAKAAPQMVQQTAPVQAEATIWKVAELPSMPAAYFLERTNVYVDGSAQEVANRICDSLRTASIASKCSQEDKNLIHAETCDSVRFAVRLFADQGKVVVEVQRKCGCSYQFREAAKSVLRSAKGVKSSPPKPKFTLPSSIPRQSQEQQQQRSEDGFKVAMSQLGSNLVDSQLIGMETLEQLTRCECKAAASKSVLGDECIDKVVSAVQLDVFDARTDIEERHNTMMKRRALTVLANALCALSESRQLEEVLQGCSQITCSSFVTSLMDTLGSSEDSPHEATQAARCMQKLMLAKEVKEHLLDMSAITVVSEACSSGACRSALLESEARKLKQSLAQCI